MKKNKTIIRIGLALLAVVGFSSCTTTYDAYGRPVQSVDPAAAAVGALAIGAVGYAIGHNDSHCNNGYYGGGGYYRPPYGCW